MKKLQVLREKRLTLKCKVDIGNQVNISITRHLAGYIRKNVKSGRYNNASEVVREALQRMKEQDARAIRFTQPGAEDILFSLSGKQIQGIRQSVRAGIESLERGDFTEYEGREGLNKLSKTVKAKGCKLLRQKT